MSKDINELKAHIAVNVKNILREHTLLAGCTISSFLSDLDFSEEVIQQYDLFLLNDELDKLVNNIIASGTMQAEEMIRNFNFRLSGR
ncbi:MAG: hypothetical protein K0Q51_728 [Rickettsiaceae bacterium]|jgi:hypothetical protein|nr:hypothetical protein [Rickettsiaceae bacterium]